MSKKLVRKPWSSSITEVERNELITYGINQRQIIREFSFEDVVFFLLTGKKPDSKQRNLPRGKSKIIEWEKVAGETNHQS